MLSKIEDYLHSIGVYGWGDVVAWIFIVLVLNTIGFGIIKIIVWCWS